MFISCKYTIFPPNFVCLSHKVKELLEAGAIGEPRVLTATLCYQMESISLSYADGKMANLQSGAVALNDRQDSLVYATFPTRVLGKSSHTSII